MKTKKNQKVRADSQSPSTMTLLIDRGVTPGVGTAADSGESQAQHASQKGLMLDQRIIAPSVETVTNTECKVFVSALWLPKPNNSPFKGRTPAGVKHSEHYKPAKTSKDFIAANKLVDAFVSKNVIKQINEIIQGDRTSLVVFPHLDAICATQNAIPTIMAYTLADQLGARVCTDIVQVDTVSRRHKNWIEKLASQPTFAGDVDQGRKYVIVDDNITQGGTVRALKQYIESCGGIVPVVSALFTSYQAMAPNEKIGHPFPLMIGEETLKKLRKMDHGRKIETIFNDHGRSFTALTEREAQTILEKVRGIGNYAETIRCFSHEFKRAYFERGSCIAATATLGGSSPDRLYSDGRSHEVVPAAKRSLAQG